MTHVWCRLMGWFAPTVFVFEKSLHCKGEKQTVWLKWGDKRDAIRADRGGNYSYEDDSWWSGNNGKHFVLLEATICFRANHLQCSPIITISGVPSTGALSLERQTKAWCKYSQQWRSSSSRCLSPLATWLAFQTVLVLHQSLVFVCMPSQPCRWRPVQAAELKSSLCSCVRGSVFVRLPLCGKD